MGIGNLWKDFIWPGGKLWISNFWIFSFICVYLCCYFFLYFSFWFVWRGSLWSPLNSIVIYCSLMQCLLCTIKGVAHQGHWHHADKERHSLCPEKGDKVCIQPKVGGRGEEVDPCADSPALWSFPLVRCRIQSSLTGRLRWSGHILPGSVGQAHHRIRAAGRFLDNLYDAHVAS